MNTTGRLTRRHPNGTVGIAECRYYNFDDFQKMAKKLADYEDAEEQGLLLRLPIAEGAMVYEIRNNTDACYDCPCYSDFYGMDAMCDKVKTDNVSGPRYADKPLCEKQFLEIIEFKAGLDFIFRHRSDFGKTVFLTREEAEAVRAREEAEK